MYAQQAIFHPKAPCNQPFNKEIACMVGQTVTKNLRRRQADWEQMTNDIKFKAPIGAYHKPGSIKK